MSARRFGAASILAAQGGDLAEVVATMLAFGLGAALPLTALGLLRARPCFFGSRVHKSLAISWRISRISARARSISSCAQHRPFQASHRRWPGSISIARARQGRNRIIVCLLSIPKPRQIPRPYQARLELK